MSEKRIRNQVCSGPPSRREFLQLGFGGFAGLSLPGLFRLQAEASQVERTKPSERTAVILVWLPGGASHLETYDPKPKASSAYRGPFSPIATKTPGLDICELLPRHAAISDKFSILRSMVHTGFCHQQGTQQLLTGHPERVLGLGVAVRAGRPQYDRLGFRHLGHVLST